MSWMTGRERGLDFFQRPLNSPGTLEVACAWVPREEAHCWCCPAPVALRLGALLTHMQGSKVLPGAACGSFSLVLLQQTSPLRKMRSVRRGGEDVIFKEILGSLMKLLFQAS